MTTTVVLTAPAHDQDCIAAAQAAARELTTSETRFVVRPHRPPVDVRAVYTSAATPEPKVQADLVIPYGHRTVHNGLLNTLKAYYRDPLSWFALAITSLLLCYGGGAAMFYVHSVHYGEGGPAISPYLHWFLDSTFGLIGLTPVLAVLLPFAARYFRGWGFALAVGVLFALVTVPGPLAHDLLVARGTPIAEVVTRMFGDPYQVLPPPADHTALAKMTHQLLAGLPVYVTLSAVSYALVRLGMRLGGATGR